MQQAICHEGQIKATLPAQLFPMGKLFATPGFLDAVGEGAELMYATACLADHLRGDWTHCTMGDEDNAANTAAITEGTRVFTAWETPGGVKFWIITEWDRSVTTFLLPSEY